MAIDWDLIRINWNEDYKTNFSNRKEFLGRLYKEKESGPKIANLLLVSSTAINHALKKDGIKLLPKGHRFPSAKQKIILEMNTLNKTIKEIAITSKLTISYTWFLLKKFKKGYKQG